MRRLLQPSLPDGLSLTPELRALAAFVTAASGADGGGRGRGRGRSGAD